MHSFTPKNIDSNFIKKILFFALLLFLFLLGQDTYSQVVVRKVFLTRKNVFDSTNSDWFFAAGFANTLHTMTKKYVIDDEILFEHDEELYPDDAEETERNLRRTGLFANVVVKVDTIDDRTADIHITTQDIWSTHVSPVFSTGGGISSWGGFFREINLAGTGSSVTTQAQYRTENNIGWDGYVIANYRRMFRSELSLSLGISGHRYRTTQILSLGKPFRTLSSFTSYGVGLYNSHGSDFVYTPEKTSRVPYHSRRGEGWFSIGLKRKDRIFFSSYFSLEDIKRLNPTLRQPFDNSGKLLFGFSSLQQRFSKTNKLNGYETEDVSLGGWGTAIIGRTFAIGSQGEGTYYIGGQIQQSVTIGKGYIFGQLTGSSAFATGNPRYTYQEFNGVAHYRFSENMLIASRIRQQTVWNWGAFRQLILDNDAGLRGYAANGFEGANRIIGNTEFRFYPEWDLWIFRLSGILFHDIGTVWNQSETLPKTSFYNTIGAGLRIHNLKASGGEAVFRIDFAYNTYEKKFGGIIISSGQLFSIFGSHGFRLPEIFGLNIDGE